MSVSSSASGSNAHFPFTVCVEGNIGSGKSTFLNYMSQVHGLEILCEPVDKWTNLGGENILGNFYADPATWGMTFQTMATVSMLESHLRSNGSAVKVMERSLFSTRYCFVESMTTNGILLPGMRAVLDNWYEFIDSYHQIKVDTFVYLRTTPTVALQRVVSRDRSEEHNINLDYLRHLHQLHESWLGGRAYDQDGTPIITIDANLSLLELDSEYQQCKDEILRSADFIESEIR